MPSDTRSVRYCGLFSLIYIGLILPPALPAQAVASGPATDNGGNAMLSGNYNFRHVLYILATIPDINGTVGDFGEQTALYGNISFDGNGNYVIANGMVSDTILGLVDPLSCYLAQAVCETGVPVYGTYTISASGFGYLTNPITLDRIYGLVAADGVFSGSSTESTLAYNDLFIGAPVGSAPPTNASFQGLYRVAGYIPAENPLNASDVFFQMNPDGAGNLGMVYISGFMGGSGTTTVSQSSMATYSFSEGAGSINFPMDPNASFYSGPEVIYFSPDGNFFFGGSPDVADMIVGVTNPSIAQNFSGLFYQAGIDQNLSKLSAGTADLDGYYGSLNAGSDGNIVSDQRLSDIDLGVHGVTFADSFTNPVTGPFVGATTSQQYAVSNGGAVRIGQDSFPLLGISVALQAPALGSPSAASVWLNPTGMVNAASNAPFTAGISAGELLTLSGSNLSSNTATVSAPPFPLALGGVGVTVNGVMAPIYSAAPNQLSIVVPFEISGPVASFQVTNSGAVSNSATEIVNQTTPGVFTADSSGFGTSAALHANGTPISPSSPAQLNETVAFFLTGLGTVSPSIPDGAPAPGTPLSFATNMISATIGGVPANVTFAGLAPQAAGVYQVNLQIPSSAAPGENVVAISGPDSTAMQATIAVAGGSADRVPAKQIFRVRPRESAVRKRTPVCFFGGLSAMTSCRLPSEGQPSYVKHN